MIWFDDTKSMQTGSLRRFISPPLAQGHAYTYKVRVRWKEHGNEVTQSRCITVRAGEQVSITFPPPSAANTR
jgi:uncharacterized protein (TIGR03000 family)